MKNISSQQKSVLVRTAKKLKKYFAQKLSIFIFFCLLKVRNATAVFIINLSMSDLLFCCFNLPLAASTFHNKEWVHGRNNKDSKTTNFLNDCQIFRWTYVPIIPTVSLRAPGSFTVHDINHHNQSLHHDFSSTHLS